MFRGNPWSTSAFFQVFYWHLTPTSTINISKKPSLKVMSIFGYIFLDHDHEIGWIIKERPEFVPQNLIPQRSKSQNRLFCTFLQQFFSRIIRKYIHLILSSHCRVTNHDMNKYTENWEDNTDARYWVGLADIFTV